MPVGVQQTIEGLLCVLCNNVLDDDSVSPNTETVCMYCEDEFVRSCSSCYHTVYHSGLMSLSQYNAARRSNDIEVGELIVADDTGEYMCSDCVTVCENCGCQYEYEDSMLECCEQDNDLHSYCYRPSYLYYETKDDGTVVPKIYETPGLLYMGAEIEIAKMAHLVRDFKDSLSRTMEDFIYFKEDGSIGPDGAELVTMPATLDAFKKMFPFDELEWARSAGARSFYYDSCGFHIHVARSAFSTTHMWKFIKLQLNNPMLCQRVAQRTESSYATWYYEEHERQDLPEYVKGKRHNGRRYLAINFQNRATVELRYFKGNILASAIMKNMEFVQSMYDYTKKLSVRDVMAGALSDTAYLTWVAEQESYPNLNKFLATDSNEGVN